MTPDEAQAALDSVGTTNEKMADRMQWPWWRHAAAGLVLALPLAFSVLEPRGQAVAAGIFVLLIYLIIRDDKKRHGMFVSGYQKGRTSWVLALNGIVFIAALMAMNSWVTDGTGDPLFWVLTIGLALVSAFLSYVWEIVYRADLRRGDA